MAAFDLRRALRRFNACLPCKIAAATVWLTALAALLWLFGGFGWRAAIVLIVLWAVGCWAIAIPVDYSDDRGDR